MNVVFPDLRGKQRTKAVPPIPHGLIADLDATLEQEVFDLSQRQRVSDIQHHREADHFGRTVEITERIVHHRRLRDLTSQLKTIYSDNAPAGIHPPAGGYVVALSVTLADLWKVGFATPLRDSIQFRYCTVDAARVILLAQEGSTDKAFVT